MTHKVPPLCREIERGIVMFRCAISECFIYTRSKLQALHNYNKGKKIE